jgi:hypothetical protein
VACVSGLARAVDWTQRIGYSYPQSSFQAALKATFPKLTDREVMHCVTEYDRSTAEWNTRIWGHEFFDFTPDPQVRA